MPPTLRETLRDQSLTFNDRRALLALCRPEDGSAEIEERWQDQAVPQNDRFHDWDEALRQLLSEGRAELERTGAIKPWDWEAAPPVRGRAKALADLRGWIESSACRVFVITDDDRSSRRSLLAEAIRLGGISVAVSLEGLGAHNMPALQAFVRDTDLLRELAGESGVIGVEGLNKNHALARVLVEALEQRPGARLVVTCDRSIAEAYFTPLSAAVIDLDKAGYVDPSELAVIVGEVMGDAATREQVERIVAQAGTSYSFAEALARWAKVHPGELRLPPDVEAAVRGEVHKRGGPSARSLFVALAHTKGPISKELWARVASVVHQPVTLHDAESVSGELEHWLTVSGDDAVAISQPHVAACFRNQDETATHAAIYDSVITAVRDGWLGTDTPAWRYAVAHLAAHAADGERLDALILEHPAFLLAVEPDVLVPQLVHAQSAPASALAHAYRRAAPRLRGATVEARMVALALSCRQADLDPIADELLGLRGADRTPLWNGLAPIEASIVTEAPHILVGTHDGASRAVTVTREATPRLATGDDRGNVALWDAHTGAATEAPVRVGDSVLCLVACEGDAVVAGRAGADAVRVVPRADPVVLPGSGEVRAAASFDLDGERVVATAGKDGAIRVWSAADGSAMPPVAPPPPRSGGLRALCVASRPGAPLVLASAGEDGRVVFWRRDGDAWREEPTKHVHGDWVVALAAIPALDLLLSADCRGYIHQHQLTGGASRGPLVRHDHPLRALAAVEVEERWLAVAAGDDGDLHAWDVESGQPVATLAGHLGRVRCLVKAPDGRLLSAGDDRTVRAWDGLDAAALERSPDAAEDARTTCVVTGTIKETPATLTALANGVVTIQPDDGRPPATLPHAAPVRAAAVLTDVVVTASDDGLVRVWDVEPPTVLSTYGLTGPGAVVASVRGTDNEFVALGADGSLVHAKPGGALHQGRLGGLGLPVRDAVVVDGGDESILLVARDGRHASRYDLDGRPVTGAPNAGSHRGWVTCVVAAQHRQFRTVSVVITGGEDGAVLICDRGSGRQLDEHRLSGAVRRLAVQRRASGYWLAAGGTDGKVLAGPVEEPGPPIAVGARVTGLAWRENGDRPELWVGTDHGRMLLAEPER